MTSAKLHFPNLNGLRFIAAFLVIVGHFHQTRANFGLSGIWDNTIIQGFGEEGVNIFFVLSGFLITILLLQEKRVSQTISLKNFYARRILRIWPLYFLIIGFCFFAVPHIDALYVPGMSINASHFWHSLMVFACILPSFAMHLFGQIPLASMTWSIGVEEVFYLITPLLLKYARRALPAFIVFSLLFLFLGNGFIQNPTGNRWLGVLILFLADLRLTCLGLGSIAAILYFNNPLFVKKWLMNIPVQAVAYILALDYMLRLYEPPLFPNEIFSLLFAVIVLNLAANPASFIRLTHPVLEYLGKISYGIYMFHIFPIVLLCNVWPDGNSWLVFLLDIGITIALAALSYHYFENYFLRLKKHFHKG